MFKTVVGFAKTLTSTVLMKSRCVGHPNITELEQIDCTAPKSKKNVMKKNDCSTSIHNHISMNPPLSANQTQSLNCCFSLSAFGDQHWEDPSKDFDRMWWIWQMWTLSTCTGRSCSKLTFVSAIPFFCCPVATIQFYAILVQFQHLLLCDNCLACQQPVKTKPVRAIANT